MALWRAANFSLAELGGASAPAIWQSNLAALGDLLQSVRDVVGVPMRVTSGYRSDAANAAIPGAASNSQHETGSAADFKPVGITQAEFMRRFDEAERAGKIPTYGQLIVYTDTGHIHLSLPNGSKRREKLVKTSEPGYRPYSLSLLGAASLAWVVLLLALLLLVALGRKG